MEPEALLAAAGMSSETGAVRLSGGDTSEVWHLGEWVVKMGGAQGEMWAAEVRGGRLQPRTGQWRRLNDVGDLPMANPQRRVVKVLRERQA